MNIYFFISYFDQQTNAKIFIEMILNGCTNLIKKIKNKFRIFLLFLMLIFGYVRLSNG